jgi:hypothetical protein
MRDITILYYTANLISGHFSKQVRDYLLTSSMGVPIISISQRPMDFGENICVGEIGANIFNLYKQILIGAKKAKTRFVACCEDDTLYIPEHFTFETPNDAFYYNINHWHLCTDVFYYQGHRIMSQCVAPTDMLINSLELRFAKFPDLQSVTRGFGEPGRGERHIGLPEVKIDRFRTQTPSITFRHDQSLSGRRRIRDRYTKASALPHWGKASELWGEVYGR